MNIRKINFIMIGLIGVGVFSRVMDHIPNFTPLVGLALWITYRWGKRPGSLFILITMWISDFFLGIHSWEIQILVYGALLFPVLLGTEIRRLNTILSKYSMIFGISVFSGVMFYLITNFGVWLYSGMYQHTWEGLLQCYIMAIPFFKNTLAGNIFSSFMIFGIHDLITWLLQKRIWQQA